MLILLLLGFLYVFFRGVGGTTVSRSDTGTENSLTESLLLGQTGLRRFEGERIWITRVSPAQREQAKTLSRYLVSSAEGCVISGEFCALSANTGQTGVELSFTESHPAQLPNQTPWFGGFVNPLNGAVYDRLGRAYKLAGSTPAKLKLRNVSDGSGVD